MLSIDHLGIAVKSLASAAHFYRTLGLFVEGEEIVKGEQVRVAMVPLGESRIELLEPIADSSPIAKFLAKRGEGLHHVALHVHDLAATVERMKQVGTRFVSDDIKIGAGGHAYFFASGQRQRRPAGTLRGAARGRVNHRSPLPIVRSLFLIFDPVAQRWEM